MVVREFARRWVFHPEQNRLYTLLRMEDYGWGALIQPKHLVYALPVNASLFSRKGFSMGFRASSWKVLFTRRASAGISFRLRWTWWCQIIQALQGRSRILDNLRLRLELWYRLAQAAMGMLDNSQRRDGKTWINVLRRGCVLLRKM